MAAMPESKYQAYLVRKLKDTFPAAVVLIPNPNHIQGFPDLLVLAEDTWFALEVKKSAIAPKRPNQDYYVDKLHKMSFAAFIYPENETEVFLEIQQALLDRGYARPAES
jgi:hypothetical protein